MTTLDSQTNRVAYYGKYRATCVNNIDPMLQGRIQLIVPDVSAVAPTSWAMPCFPVTGIQNGVFTVPPIGAGVWVEFEQGDPDYPIWVGGYYARPTCLPPPGWCRRACPASPFRQRCRTASPSATPGTHGRHPDQDHHGAMIAVNDLGITISNGKGATITMVGPAVDINVGALTVI